MDSGDELGESRRRRREEDDIGDEERRERKRRFGWTEEAMEEHDRLREESILERLQSYRDYEELAAREREEEDERKKWDPACRKAILAMEVPAVGEAREQDCAVCLQEFVHGGKTLRKMECSHSFHQCSASSTGYSVAVAVRSAVMR